MTGISTSGKRRTKVSLDRMTVPVHDIGEFHKWHNHETGRQTLTAERITDYDTHHDLPMHILIHDNGKFTAYSARTRGADAFFNANDPKDYTEVRLTAQYIPDNTAIRFTDPDVELVEETSEGWIRILAVGTVETGFSLKVADISRRYAELLMISHENFGREFDDGFAVLKQFSNPPWAFKVFSDNNRYE